MEKYSLFRLSGFTNEQLRDVLNGLNFKGGLPDPKAKDFRMRVIDLICNLQDGKKPASSSFVVADHFTVVNSEIKFLYISRNFKSHFFGKTEERMILPRVHHDLCQAASIREVLDNIDGEDKVEVTLFGIYELLKLQPNGEAGTLLAEDHGHANIFYVRDVVNVLYAVSVHLWNSGWCMDAISIKEMFKWDIGHRVFSS